MVAYAPTQPCAHSFAVHNTRAYLHHCAHNAYSFAVSYPHDG